MHRLAAAVLALAALVALPACDSGSDAVGLTGTWEGVVYDATAANATRYPIVLDLQDSGLRITGSGHVDELPEGRLDLAITNGQFLEDLSVQLEFLLSIGGQQVPPFSGSLSGRLTNRDPGRIEGTFSGRGAVGNSLVRIEITSR